MVHLDGVVADTRGSRNFADLHENVGGAKSLRGEALTEYMIMLTRRSGRLHGLYPYQTKGNEHKRESCLVEFFSRPRNVGRRL